MLQMGKKEFLLQFLPSSKGWKLQRRRSSSEAERTSRSSFPAGSVLQGADHPQGLPVLHNCWLRRWRCDSDRGESETEEEHEVPVLGPQDPREEDLRRHRPTGRLRDVKHTEPLRQN